MMPAWLTDAMRHLADAVYGRTTAGAAHRQRLADEGREAISETQRQMTEAMGHYEAGWRGHDMNAEIKARKAAGMAAARSSEIEDEAVQALVARWHDLFKRIDINYTGATGPPPAGHDELEAAYREAGSRIGDLLIAARRG
jgi:hypothetical protein